MKILVAMSGGVDSTVAAELLTKSGYECVGCTMRLWDGENEALPPERSCCPLEDTEYAKEASMRLRMPYYVFNFKDDFKEKVISKFAASYERGMTPNPCIDCNRYMKFEKLFERADILGCEKIATGHYARISFDDGRYRLKKATDLTKDQSYVLYSLTQHQLSRILFPLGEMCKTEARETARKAGFTNADKADSQDICFVPDGDYAGFIERFFNKKFMEGDFIDREGHSIGRHRGLIHYTVGQRKGLGVSFAKPMYVCSVSPSDNTVTLGDDADLYSRDALLSDVNWISGDIPTSPIRLKARIRYRKPEEWATVTPTSDTSAKIVFDEPQRAITPGQACVFYDRDEVLGGGTVERMN